jgi:hypothetical protein
MELPVQAESTGKVVLLSTFGWPGMTVHQNRWFAGPEGPIVIQSSIHKHN